MNEFVHLHLHTEYSLLDGACRIDRLMPHLKELGQTAVAITDHGTMFGAIAFYKQALQAGIKPIIGCEVYVAPRTMQDKVHKIDSSPYHLVLLCENLVGYQNLIALVSQAALDGFYQKPRVDLQLLAKHAEGLIALSACLAGQIPRLLSAGQYADARAAAIRYRDIFGADHYFIEVQNHGMPEQQQILPLLRTLATEIGVGLVATNDAHYIARRHSKMQHVLTCIQTNTTVESSNLEFATDEFFVKSRAEMAQALPNFTDALDNTVKIAERCNVTFTFGELKLPLFTLPGVTDNAAYFRQKCEAGLLAQYGNHPDTAILQRLDYELSVIETMGYVDYFLIVHDFIAFAQSKGIPVGPGRGSGAGSLAAYCIGITGIDPIRYNLIFERFLNPERVSMPDFDIDFCYVRRPEVIEYVVNRYGADHVAQIITFGTLAARAAIRDTGRALGKPYQQVDAIAKSVPNELGITLEKALHSADFKRLYEADPHARELIDMAMDLEGMPRHASTHAAGVVITREPVSHYVPLTRGEDAIVTQYPMGTLEELGLLKMDFLGLRNLTVISDCQKQICKRQPAFDIGSIPLDDRAVYEMLSKGYTEGVFQFESAGMRQALMQLRPEYLEDLIAVISLYRPGPMDSIPTYIRNRHHPEKVTYKHPSLEPILAVTYGCIVYQEQVMQIFRALAGFSYGRADLVRRAMSKKKHAVMQQEGQGFIAGCLERGIPESIARDIFEEMSSFASYAFNKSHAAAYALISYQTAYLKCHYPKEYMAALLTSVLDFTDKAVGYIQECRRINIPVLPPDVQESEEYFTPTEKGIRFGLLAIKNVGRGIVNSIVAVRQQGPFLDFQDFCQRLHPFDLRRRPLESLIKSGSLDALGTATRRAMCEGCDIVLQEIDQSEKSNVSGQLNLFGEGSQAQTPLPQVAEYPPSQLLKMEKEVLGLFLSGHPLDDFAPCIRNLPITTIQAILDANEHRTPALCDDAKLSIACILTARKNMLTKKGDTMAYVTAEDLTASLEVVVFSKLLEQHSGLLQPDAALLLSGRISFREDEPPKLILEAATPLSQLNVHTGRTQSVGATKQVEAKQTPTAVKNKGLYVKVDSPQDERWHRAQKFLEIFIDGSTPVYVYFTQTKQLTKAPQSLWIAPNQTLLRELSALLGESCVVLR